MRSQKQYLSPNPSTQDTVVTNLFQAVADRSSLLRVNLKDGYLWQGKERMVLLYQSTFANLIKELFNFNPEEVKRLLYNVGYSAGYKAALYTKETIHPNDLTYQFHNGLQLASLSGFSAIQIEALTFNAEKNNFHAIVSLTNSIEANMHIEHRGIAHHPACWLHAGYISGFASTLMNQPIIFEEIACRAMGHFKCKLRGEIKNVDHSELPQATQEIILPSTKPNSKDEPMVVGNSAAFQGAVRLLEKVAPTDSSVLLIGETGVGKGVFARLCHQKSRRFQGPYLTINCAALPENLIEAELFGVEKGAFTGAYASRPGRIECAANGTLFLDEISSLSLASQAKLLRVLQEKEFERVGDTRVRHANVRIIAASNSDLKEAIRQGTFRQDLYFRLSTFPIYIPPLRERREDILALITYFLQKYKGDKNIQGFTKSAFAMLLSYHFPGNIRELEHMVERAIILVDEEDFIDVGHLFASSEMIDIQRTSFTSDGVFEVEESQVPLPANLVHSILEQKINLADLEKNLIKEALSISKGNIAKAARLLGMTRRQLEYRLQKETTFA